MKPLVPVDLHSQLQRMAAELLLIPFRAAQVRRRWSGLDPSKPVGGQFEVAPTIFGASVYYDILAEGGEGTRWEVRRVVDRMLLKMEIPPVDHPTMHASIQVATLRVREPLRVSEPLLPDLSSYTYAPEPFDDEATTLVLREASTHGRRVQWRLNAHANGTVVRSGRGLTYLSLSARRAWRHARTVVVSEGEWRLHVEEREALTQFTRALRAPDAEALGRRRMRPKGTRHITLDD